MKKIVVLIMSLFLGTCIFSQEYTVTFNSGNLTLDGTLSIPNGVGPFPIIVFVHGSGASDRNQSVHITGGNAQCLYPNLYNDTISNFKDLSDFFADKGIATFRYDKRTYSYQTLNPIVISPYDFIIDIHSAIDYIKTRSEVDINNIMLLGHSQGGNFIPLVAKERSDIKALISLGSPARGIDTIIAEQARFLYYTCLNDTIAGDAYYNQTLLDFSQMRNGNWSSTTPYLGAYMNFWTDWFDITDSSVINYNSINNPTLFLHAMEDYNIPLIDAQIYESQLSLNSDLYYLDGLNHFFTTSNIPNVSEVVPDTIIYWLGENNIISNYEMESSLNINNKTILKVVDVLGREIKSQKNTPLFYIFDDGTVEKKIILE